MSSVAAQIFALLIFVVVLFQLALMLGAPWGNVAMGGRFPGKIPPVMRIAALIQGLVLGVIGFIVLIRGQVLNSNLYEITEIAIWVVVTLMGLSLVMNLVTPSRWERIIWAPVVVVLFTCSVVVALS